MTTITRATLRKVNPDALTKGEPLVVLSVGDVFSEFTGRKLPGNITDVAQLHAMVDYFERYQKPAGQLPLIDWNHRAVGNSEGATVDEQIPIGAAVDLRVEGEDLIATPGWTARGVTIKDAAEGLLYPSATYVTDPVYDRATGEQIAAAAFFAFAVTTQPATRVDKLGAIRSQTPAATIAAQRAADAAKEPGMNPEEIIAAIDGLDDEGRAQVASALNVADAVDEPETRMEDEPADEVEARGDYEKRSAEDGLAAIVRAQGEKIAAFEARERLKLRAQAIKGIAPAYKAAAEALFDREPDADVAVSLVRRSFAAAMVDTSAIGNGTAGERKGGEPKADAVPTDPAGLTAYVKRNQAEGETFGAALERIKRDNPAAVNAAAVTINGGR